MKVQKKLISDDLSNSIRKVLILYGKVLLWVGYFIKPLVLEVYSGRNIFYFISSRTFNFNSSNIILFAFDLLTSIFLIPFIDFPMITFLTYMNLGKTSFKSFIQSILVGLAGSIILALISIIFTLLIIFTVNILHDYFGFSIHSI